MNRVPKYRVWVPKLNKMFEVTSINWTCKEVSFPGSIEFERNTFTFDKVNLSESTSLKDKNGKEIYEGDIFNCIYDYEGCKNHKFAVVWVDEDARFGLKSYGECQQPGVHQNLFDMQRKEIKGNIFENPSLLHSGGQGK